MNERVITFQGDSFEHIEGVVDQAIRGALPQSGTHVSLFEFYGAVADALPGYVSREANEKAIAAIASEDTDLSTRGTVVLLALNLKSVLKSVTPYRTHDTDRDNDLIQYVLKDAVDHARRLKGNYYMSQRFHEVTRKSAIRFSKEQDRQEHDDITTVQVDGEEFMLEIMTSSLVAEELKNMTKRLSVNERFVLEQKYVKGRIVEDIGKDLHVNDSRVRKLEDHALKKLRSLYMSLRLRKLVDEELSVIFSPPENPASR